MQLYREHTTSSIGIYGITPCKNAKQTSQMGVTQPHCLISSLTTHIDNTLELVPNAHVPEYVLLLWKDRRIQGTRCTPEVSNTWEVEGRGTDMEEFNYSETLGEIIKIGQLVHLNVEELLNILPDQTYQNELVCKIIFKKMSN